MAAAERVITIPYSPRKVFLPFHRRTERFAIGVAHRRAGKTVACVNDLIAGALACPREAPRFAYLAPFFNQAKDVAWEYVKRYAAPADAQVNESELRVDFPSGARVRLYGADNPDRLRGLYLDGVVLDEYAQMQPAVWSEVIRPALADRGGWAVFIGTPMGRNAFHALYESARADPAWHTFVLRASETGLIAAEELAAAAKDMTPEQYAQEFECSFEAAIVGAYYGRELAAAEREQRIASVPWEPRSQVWTAWDLGIGDSTAIWFAQQVGNEVRIIDFIENSGVALSWYAAEVAERRQRGWVFAEHLLPHDAEARELGTGKSRMETLDGLGIRGKLLPADKVDDGISAARLLLPRCWFDAAKCARGIEALRQYRTEWDDRRKVFRDRPLHDWTSHACLVGETLVETARGDVPISAVRVGDRVRTPAGYGRVQAAGPVGRATELVEIVTVDGRSIICTPEHRIFTTSGLIEAGQVTKSHLLLSGGEEVCIRASLSSMAGGIGFRDAITAATAGDEAARPTFTARFGSIITARFRRAITSIIGTVTGSTTTSPISNSSLQRGTCPSIAGQLPIFPPSAPASNGRERLRWSGIGRQWGESGIPSMAAPHGPGASGPNVSARSAAEVFARLFRSEPSSATRIARLRRFGGAEASRLVYDLTVERHHCYRANGLLVSNSDAFRYLAMGLRAPGKPVDVPEGYVGAGGWLA